MQLKATDQELAEFALAHLPSSPVAKRSALCRRLADLVDDLGVKTALHAQAATLDEVSEDHRQLMLRLIGGAR